MYERCTHSGHSRTTPCPCTLVRMSTLAKLQYSSESVEVALETMLYVLNMITKQFSGCSSQGFAVRYTPTCHSDKNMSRSVIPLKFVPAVDSRGKFGTEATGVPTQWLLYPQTTSFSAGSFM